MEKKLTANQEAVLAVLKQFEEGAFADEVTAKIEGGKIASVRSTLTSLAKAGYATKVDAEHNNKIYKKFTAVNSAE